MGSGPQSREISTPVDSCEPIKIQNNFGNQFRVVFFFIFFIPSKDIKRNGHLLRPSPSLHYKVRLCLNLQIMEDLLHEKNSSLNRINLAYKKLTRLSLFFSSCHEWMKRHDGWVLIPRQLALGSDILSSVILLFDSACQATSARSARLSLSPCFQ